jgi:hypothetical protein
MWEDDSIAMDAAWNRRYETFACADEDERVEDEYEGEEEPDSGWVPACGEAKRIMEADTSAGVMFDALKAHRPRCAACLAEQREVQAEPIELRKPMTVCCEPMKEVA